jgi:hypothetical protein
MPRRVVAMPSLMRLVDVRGIGVAFRDGEVRVTRSRANIWVGGTGSPAFGRGCGRRLISVWIEQTVVESQTIFRIDIPRNARDIRRHLKSRHGACSNTHKRWRWTFVVPLLGGEREKPV